jgi:ElaB/YqjD/DUF883 family membrane-anchored ribosome-binding protein
MVTINPARFNPIVKERIDMTVTETKRIDGGVKPVADDADELLTTMTDETPEKIKQLRVRLAATVESAKAAMQRLEKRTVSAARSTDRCIREHPYQTIGIAFGLGLLVGMLVIRRKN